MPFLDQRYQLPNSPQQQTLLRPIDSVPPAAVFAAGAHSVIVCAAGAIINLPRITPEIEGRVYYVKRLLEVDPGTVQLTPDLVDSVGGLPPGAPYIFGGASSQDARAIIAWLNTFGGPNQWLLFGSYVTGE